MSISADTPIIQQLLISQNPVILFKVHKYLLKTAMDSPEMTDLQEQIRTSIMARALLSQRRPDGTIYTNPYAKWQGPHWTLFCLAQIEYPPGDSQLLPLLNQAYDWMLAPEHFKFPRSLTIPGQEDRVRRCGSQEGNAVWYSMKLGLVEKRTSKLADNLIKFQWPDGGWNCDKRPQAHSSSFIETLIPLRALWHFGKTYERPDAISAAEKGFEFLLKRSLYKRLRDGQLIRPEFLQTHYPIQFYDILFALKVMAETSHIEDIRCREALDLLEAKRQPSGGFPLERPMHKTSTERITRGTYADWGVSGKKRNNDFVTIDALYVLQAAGRD